jgi:hypothetical protein
VEVGMSAIAEAQWRVPKMFIGDTDGASFARSRVRCGKTRHDVPGTAKRLGKPVLVQYARCALVC